jgi:glucokinase
MPGGVVAYDRAQGPGRAKETRSMAQLGRTLTLVADIGGTNTRVALATGPAVHADTVRRYANGEHPDLEAVLRRYLREGHHADPAAACVAAAGPVREGAVQMTNIAHWPVIDKAALERSTGAQTVAVLNDLQAQGHALGHIAAGLTRTVLPFPEAGPHAAKLVIGVGTGFNAAPVFDTEGRRLIPPSEAGHVSLPVHSEEDARLAAWLVRSVEGHHFASVEEVLSGRGIEQVYAWLAEEDGVPDRADAARIMAAVSDGSDPRAERAARVMARMLGAVAGNLALIQLPFGGIWLVGGVARALAPYLLSFGFEDGFILKGRFSGFMRSFGVGVIEDDFAALTGCASHLVGLLREGHTAA